MAQCLISYAYGQLHLLPYSYKTHLENESLISMWELPTHA
jgi:hypothetical protein